MEKIHQINSGSSEAPGGEINVSLIRGVETSLLFHKTSLVELLLSLISAREGVQVPALCLSLHHDHYHYHYYYLYIYHYYYHYHFSTRGRASTGPTSAPTSSVTTSSPSAPSWTTSASLTGQSGSAVTAVIQAVTAVSIAHRSVRLRGTFRRNEHELK